MIYCSLFAHTLFPLFLHRHMFGTLTHPLRHYTQKKEYLPKSLSKHNFLFSVFCILELLYIHRQSRAGAAPHRVVGQMECELNDAMHARTCLPHPWHYAAAACEAKSDDSGLGYTATLAG